MATEQTITITEVKSKIKWHLDEAQKLQSALDVLSVFSESQNHQTKLIVKDGDSKPTAKPIIFKDFKVVVPDTFKSVVIDIFKAEKKPLTARQMLSLYEAKTKKKLKYSNFSGQFSGLVTREGVLKKFTFPLNPIETRYFYGLADWFAGEDLKTEYLGIIKGTQIPLI